MVLGLLLAYFASKAIQQLLSDEFEFSILYGILFGVHELGHLVLGLLGNDVLTALGGSLFQILLPIGAAALMAQRKDRVGIAICGCLLALSLGEVGVYIADARAESLDLVSMSSEGATHDWNFILGAWHMLNDDIALGHFVRNVGWLVLVLSVGFGGRELLIRQSPQSPQSPQ
ncbi:MAG TPA: hypothetical protein VGI92_06030 [Gemmatimonadales bacterium]